VIVFGGSGARQIPEAFRQLVDFGKRAGPEAQKYHITIAIEPQRRAESNIINSTAEALRWVEAVNHPNIQLMIDYYHFSVEKEDPAVILKIKDHLCHLHMANPNNRVMPLRWEEYDYAPFFAVLRQIRYRNRSGGFHHRLAEGRRADNCTAASSARPVNSENELLSDFPKRS